MTDARRVAWLTRVLLLGSLVVSGLTCDAFQPPTNLELAVVVGVSGDSIVSLKQTVRFTAAAATSAGPAPGAAFRWRSTASGVAAVDSMGTVVGRGRGRAWIIAQLVTPDFPAGGPEDSVEVWVRFGSVTLSRDTATVTAIGDTLVVVARGRDAPGLDAGPASATWQSSNDSVAAVTPEGAVIARRPGAAIITARADSLSATMQVTVRQVAARLVASVLRHDSLVFDALQADSSIGLQVLDRRSVPIANPTVSWTSSRPTVVSVLDAATGRFRSLLADTATLTAVVDTARLKVPVFVSQVVTRVELTPDTVATDALTDTLRLALALFDRNERVVVGRTPTWTSLDAIVAAVHAADASGGRFVSRGNGTTRIVASYGGVSDTTLVRVAQVARQVTVSPAARTFLALSDTATFSAQLADRLSAPISGRLPRWSSSDTTRVRVDSLGRVLAVADGTAQVRAAIDSVVGSASVVVRQAAARIAASSLRHDSLVFDALQTDSTIAVQVFDGRNVPIANPTISWTSSRPTVVGVLDAATGRFRSLLPDTATLTALVDTARLKVAVAVSQVVTRVQLTPDTVATDALTDTLRLALALFDRNGRAVVGRTPTWASLDGNVAAVYAADASGGRIVSRANGTTRVVASYGGVSDTTLVRVAQVARQVTVSPAARTFLALSDTATFSAQLADRLGAPISGRLPRWSSSDTSRVRVDSLGKVSAVGEGRAQVWATIDSIAGSASILVGVPSAVAAPDSTIVLEAIDDTVTLAGAVVLSSRPDTLPGLALTWSSNDSTVVRALSGGRVVSRANGTTYVVARYGVLRDSFTVRVAQAVRVVAVAPTTKTFSAFGDTSTLVATAMDRRATVVPGRTFRWSSANAAVVTVDSISGLVRAIGGGTSEVSAQTGGVTGQATVTVQQSIGTIDVQADTATLLAAGQTRQFTVSATDSRRNPMPADPSSVSWTSSNTAVFTVSPSTGLTTTVTAVNYGVAYVRAFGYAFYRDSSRVLVTPLYNSLAVTPATATIAAVNDTVRLSASATDAQGAAVGSPLLTWTSGDTAIATVQQTGTVTARRDGTAAITVAGGTREASATVVVHQVAIGVRQRYPPGVSGNNEFRAAGDTIRFYAEAYDRRNAPIPRLADSLRWRFDLTNNPAAVTQMFRVDSLTGLVTALGFPSYQNWGCFTIGCYQYGVSLYASVSSQQLQTGATFYPRIHTVDLRPDTIRQTRFRIDTLEVFLRDRNGYASQRLFTQSSPVRSLDTTVATVQVVDSMGIVSRWIAVTGRRPGTTRIVFTVTAHADSGATVKTADTTVVVVAPVVASVAASSDSTLLASGDRLQLSATVRDSSGTTIPGARVTWSSLDLDVARVDSTGTVSGIGAGTTRIVVASGAKADTTIVTVQNLAVLYVDASYTGATSTGSANQPFKTIGEAIVAVSDGGVVRVRAGTYQTSQTLVIDKGLRLWGDGAASTVIRYSGGSDDAVRIPSGSPVELRGIRVSGAGNHGIYAAGSGGLGPQLTLTQVTVDSSAWRGLNVSAAASLTVQGSTFRRNRDEGIRVTGGATTARFVDVLVEGNAGNGIVLANASADLVRVTVGSTAQRSGDTRTYNGSAVVLDSSVARISRLTVRSDNADTAYALVLDRGSRLTALSGSSINTKYQLSVQNGSGVDSLLDNTFSTSVYSGQASRIQSAHRDQSALLVRGNTFTTPWVSLFIAPGLIPLLVERNTFNGGAQMLALSLSGDATLRDNRFVPSERNGTLVDISGASPQTAYAVVTVVGNEFRSSASASSHGLRFNASIIQLRADSNDFVFTGGSGSGYQGLNAYSDALIQVGYNRFAGPWGYGAMVQGGGGTSSVRILRRNTVDSAAIAFLVTGYSATIDSNVVRRGASGVVIDAGHTCTQAMCVVTQNAFSNLSESGVRAVYSANRVDARGNWWGAASGPLDDDASGAGFNPAGTGVRVRDGASPAVTFSPWLEAEPEVGTPLVSLGVVSAVAIVSPAAAPTLSAIGDTVRFRAQARDGFGALISGAALVWRSSAPAVARVDSATGLLTAVTNGAATITVTAGGRSASLGATVRQVVAVVDVRPDTATLVGLGGTKSFVVLVRDARGAPVDTSLFPLTWSASDAAVVTVGGASKSGATITGAGFGVAYVHAQSGSVGDSSRVLVTPRYGSVVLTQHSASLAAVGQTVQFGVSVTDTVGGAVPAPLLTWTSTDTTRVRVDQTGLVTARGNGSALVVVGGGLRADTATVTVSQAAVALRIITPGSVRTLEIDALSDTLQMVGEVRDAQQSAIPGLPVSWQVANAAVATVGASGLLVSRAAGSTVLVARYLTTLADTIAVVVSQRVSQVTITPSNKAFAAWTDTLTFLAAARDRKGTLVAGRAASWSSADAEVAAVDPVTGRVTAGRRDGATQVRATVDGVVGTANVTVSQAMAAADVQPDTAMILALNDSSRLFTVVVRDARGETVAPSAYTVAWQVQDVAVAALVGTPSATAQVRSVALGITYLRAIATARTGTAVSVRDSSRIVVSQIYGTVALARDTATLTAVSDTVRLAATVTDTFGVTVGSPLLTWTSGDTAVATVSQVGTVWARRDGQALVTVSGGTRQDTARITVWQAAVGIRQRAPYPLSNEFRAVGDTIHFYAEAYDRRNVAIPRLADSLRWRLDLSNPAAAQAFRVDSVTGLVTALGFPSYQNWGCSGTNCYSYSANFYASVSGQQTSVGANFYPRIHTVDVRPDTVRHTRLRTDTLEVFLRDRSWFASQRLGAQTSPVRSLDTTVATVRVVPDSMGIASRWLTVTGRRPGTTRIVFTATAHADTGATIKTADTTVVVVAPVVASVVVSPDSTLLAIGDRLRLSGTARDSSGTTIPGARLTWTALDPAVALVDSTGAVSGVGAGESGVARIVALSGQAADTAWITVRSLGIVYVDSASTSLAPDGTSSAPYRTIAAGVATVSPGGVVRVRKGTYRETVVIAKRLRLWGDSAAVVTIQAAEGSDGIQVTATDTVEIRGVTVTGATYNGIGVIGDIGGGPRVTVSNVVVRNNAGLGLRASRAVALEVRNSVFRANGSEGVRVQDMATPAELSDVLVEGNAGNGIVLQRARANLARVTIGATTSRAGETRPQNGVALAVLDSSVARVTGSTLRSDNYGTTYALVLDNGSRMSLLGTSAFATNFHLSVANGSGVDSIVGNTFTSSDETWCRNYATLMSSTRVGQASLVVAGNVFDVRRGALSLSAGDGVALAFVDNTIRAGGSGCGGNSSGMALGWGNGAAVFRGNRFLETYGLNGQPLLLVSGSATLSAVGNAFEVQSTHALRVDGASAVRADSNELRSTGSAGYAIYVNVGGDVAVRFNRVVGRWQSGVYGGSGGSLTLRRNTMDSVQGGADLGQAQVRADSNTITRGQFGIQLRNDGCALATCIVTRNTLAGLTDFGVKATALSARVDARDNWWGAATGPRDEDITGLGYNPSGTGVRVYDGASSVGRIQYEPWLGVEAEGGSPLVPVGAVSTVVMVWPAAAATLPAVGDTVRYRAQARDGTGALITGASFRWQSSDGAVARADSATGLVTAVGNGAATIAAAAGGQSASLGVVVAQVVARVEVTPGTATLAGVGQTQAFGVAVRDARGVAIDTSRYALTWGTSDAGVATVSGASDVGATATGAAYGVAYVRAVAGNGVGDSSRVVVTPTYASVVLARDTATLHAVGETVQLTAAVTDGLGPVASPLLTWTTNDTGVARVDQTGLVTARGNGVARVVVSGGFQADTATVTVSQVAVALVIATVSRPDTLEIDALNDTLVARGEVRDARGAAVPGRSISWRGLNAAVLTVSGGGVLVTRQQGTAPLIATAGALADTIAVVIRQRVVAVEVSPANRTFTALSDTLTFITGVADRKGTAVVGRAVRWTSTDTAIAVVDSVTGRLTTRRNGSAVVHAAVEGVTGQANIVIGQVVAAVDVAPDTATILTLNDSSRAFTLAVRDARGVAIDSTRYGVTWGSSASGVVTLFGAAAGRVGVRSVGYGLAYVRAVVTTGSEQRADSSRVVVSAVYAGVTLARDTATLRTLTDTVRLSVSATDTVGGGIIAPLLLWMSGDTSVAVVAQTGTVTARRDGVVLITVAGGTKADTATVTVHQAAAGVRWVRTFSALTAVGDTFRLIVEVYDSRNYAIPRLADSARWRSDNTSILTVDSLTGVATCRGRSTNVHYGYANLYARAAGYEVSFGPSCVPYVLSVTLPADTVRPTRLRTDTMETWFRDRNGHRAQTLTSIARSLTSDDTTIVQVAALDSVRIVVTGRRPGVSRVILTATAYIDPDTIARKLADTVVVVVTPVVVAVQVLPDSTLLAIGDRIALRGTARDSGGTVIPQARLLWASSDPGVAAIDTAGVVAAVATGTATVSATAGAVVATMRVVVQDLAVAYVDSAYAGGSSTGSSLAPFRTIAEAVTAVTAGGVVRIRKGTYGETVVIDKRLRLWGDSAGAVTIRAASGNDGVRVTGTDSVEIRGVTITGAAYNGIGVVGSLSGGPQVTISDVVIRNNTGMGLYVVRPGALQVIRSVLRANGNEGVRIADAATLTRLTDVLIENNGGNGLLLQRARADLARVTIGGTTYRDGDSRRYNGTALAVLDSSVLRMTGSTLRSDNWGGYYALVLDDGSQLPFLGTSALATNWHLYVTGGSSVDSILDNTFNSSSQPGLCAPFVTSIGSGRAGQSRLLVRGNVFDTRMAALTLGAGDAVALEITDNTVRAGANSYEWCQSGSMSLSWGSAGATVRGNRLEQAYDMQTHPLLWGSGSGPATVVGNSFEVGGVWALKLYLGSGRVDSNEVRATGGGSGLYVAPTGSTLVRFNQLQATSGAGYGIQVAGSGSVEVSANRVMGPWSRGVYGDGSGSITLRRNTVDSAQGGVDLGQSQVLADSNTVRWSQLGIQLRSGSCTTAGCIVRQNTIVGHTDYGLRAVEVAAQVDARNNWWGSATGPRDEDASGFGFNPTGTGVRVYDGTSGNGQVRYSPWLSVEAEGGSPLVPVGAVSTVALVSPGTVPTLVAVGDTVRYRAQARDGTGALITGTSFRWQSSDGAVARVDSGSGVVTAAGNGTAMIAVEAGGQSASLGVVVAQVVARVEVTPDTATLAGVGQTRAFGVAVRDARGVAIDTSRYALTWGTSDAGVATVSGASDVGATATGAAYGVAYVRAVAGNEVGDSSRVVVTPTYASVVLARDTATLGAVWETVQFTAAVTDGLGPVASPLLTWTTNDTGVALVDQTGLVTARGNGVARVVVSGGFQADTATVTVSQVAVALVITTVSRPDTLEIDALNDTLVARAEVRDARGSVVPGRVITWRGLDTSVVRVWTGGQVASRREGATALIAASGSVADTVRLIVRQRVVTVLVSPSERAISSLTDTATFAVTARDARNVVVTGRAVQWTTADTTVATVAASTGVVTSRRNGATTVRADVEGVVGSATVTVGQVLASVDVSPDTATILALNDSSRVFTLAVRDARGAVIDSTRYSVSWSSSDAAVLTLAGAGPSRATVRSVGLGIAYVRARVTVAGTERVDSSRVAVSSTYATVVLTPDSATLVAVADTVRLGATVTDPVGGAVDDPLLLWTSSDTETAVVGQTGLVTARREGVARITVAGGSHADTSVVTVWQEATGIRLTRPAGTFTAIGDTFRVRAEAYDRNGYAVPRLAESLRWRTDNPGIISVDSFTGVLTARGRYDAGSWNGYACVYASVAGLTGGCWGYQVQPSIRTVAFASDTLRPTRLRTDTVLATFRDRNGYWSQTLSSLPNYSASAYTLWSTDTAVVQVSVLDSARILIAGRRAGVARVVLRVNGPLDTGGSPKFADTVYVSVTPVVARVELSPDSTLLVVGDRVPLRALAFDSGGVAISNAPFTWASSDASLAVVDSLGMVTGVAVGLATISATSGSVTASARVAIEALAVAWVDGSYSGSPPSTGSSIAPFRTIAEAVTAVTVGGVVRVRAGTYNETVVIAKRLHLWGDGSATTIIRAASTNDGLRVATSDTVDVRRVSIVGPASGTGYDGVSAVGDTAGARLGVRLWLTDVIVRNHVGRGLYALRPQTLVVTNSAFRNNGQEGVLLHRAGIKALFTDVTVEGNAGNGIRLTRSVAELTRVTIGGTTYRSGDSRSYNGAALAVLDTSTVRVTGSTLRSDNYSGSYAFAVDNVSRLPLLGTSALATDYHLLVGNGSGVDSVVGNTFTSSTAPWCGASLTLVGSEYAGQTGLLVRENVFDTRTFAVELGVGEAVALSFSNNTVRGGVSCSGGAAVRLSWGSAGVTVRGNRFLQAYSNPYAKPLVSGTGSGSVTAALNTFEAQSTQALYLSGGAMRVDSNEFRASGSAGYAMQLISSGSAVASGNLIQGRWNRGLSASTGGLLTIRHNTIDSALGGMDLASGSVLVDSNIVRNGQFGITLSAASCSTVSCVLSQNSLTLLTDYGMKVTTAGALVEASDNWWGSESGPRDDDDAGLDFNPSGTGVRAIDGTGDVGQIQYWPWLMVEPIGIGAPLLFAAPMLVRAPSGTVLGGGAMPPQER